MEIRSDNSGESSGEIWSRLLDYNDRFLGKTPVEPLCIEMRDEKRVLRGGITGQTYDGWAHLGALWVDEEQRGRGWGSLLLLRFEEAVQERGCSVIYGDTFDFQAPGFYEKRGYRLLYSLAAVGCRRWFFGKSLACSNPNDVCKR